MEYWHLLTNIWVRDFSINIHVTSSNQRLEHCVDVHTLHVWFTLVVFKTNFAQMTVNDLCVKLN